MGDVLIRSAALTEVGTEHGFSLRGFPLEDGGSKPTPADPENTRRQDLRRPGIAFQAEQVHGSTVLTVGRGSNLETVRGTQADALVTADPGVSVAVRTADCLPLLLACPQLGRVAAVHCGWRGVAASIVKRAVECLRAGTDSQRRPSAIVAAIGPHIRVDQFEVGEEVVDALRAVSCGAEFCRRDLGPRPHVDLARIVTAQLFDQGITTVDDVGGCTVAEPERFYSYRRDGQDAGRQVSFVVAGRT